MMLRKMKKVILLLASASLFILTMVAFEYYSSAKINNEMKLSFTNIEIIDADHGPGKYAFKDQQGSNKVKLTFPIKILSSEEIEKAEREAQMVNTLSMKCRVCQIQI